MAIILMNEEVPLIIWKGKPTALKEILGRTTLLLT